MLRMAGIKLDLISDIDMYQLIQKGMRGEVRYKSKRFSKPNHKHTETYEKDKPSKYVTWRCK